MINILYDCWLLKSIKKIIPLLRCENKATLYIQLLLKTVLVGLAGGTYVANAALFDTSCGIGT